MRELRRDFGLLVGLLAGLAFALTLSLGAQQLLPNGQRITPLAPPGAQVLALNPHLADDPGFTAGQAVSTALSPDGRTLLILTSGYNQQEYIAGKDAGKVNPADSNEYVFVFDVSGGSPRQVEALRVPNTYSGMVFSPDGATFFVAGGMDDNVHRYVRAAGGWREEMPPIALGHAHGLGIDTPPEAAGLGISAQGNVLAVADYENDALTLLRKRAGGGWTVASELDLRPGKQDAKQRGVAGGEYPYWVVIGGVHTAYVSSVRDRQVVVVDWKDATSPRITARIRLAGQPNKMILNRSGTRLYVTQDNADSVAVIATTSRRVVETISVASTHGGLLGANPNALALSPDGRTLYVTNGGENAVAVVNLRTRHLMGLIPTGWYPDALNVSANGRDLYVANFSGVGGPNPGNVRGVTPELLALKHSANQYPPQQSKGGFQVVPVPDAAGLARLTHQVLVNDGMTVDAGADSSQLFAALRQRIHHVIYIVKENRTYDQVYGDLPVGNGDARLTEFPDLDTPNLHALALHFVTLDNFLCSGGVSATGWPWSTAARTTDVGEKEVPINYASRGLDYDSEGENRNLNMGVGTAAERHAINPAAPLDADLLPGTANLVAPDAPHQGDDDDDAEAGQGYLWDAAQRAGLSWRNYGFFVKGVYDQKAPGAIPELRDPAASHTVAGYAGNPVLRRHSDPYYRGFDQAFPDFYRFREWKREFDQFVAGHNLPRLELVQLEHDHFGNFATALDGLNTPELQMADDDYSVGLLVQAVAQSPYRDDTLIFVVEDDAQDGADHVSDHRSPALVIGPYVRQHAVVSDNYDTVSALRTMEEILGLGPLNLHDAAAAPMAAVFDLKSAPWSFAAAPSRYLRGTGLPIPASAFPPGPTLRPTHDGSYWAAATRGMDFSVPDHLPSATFNALLRAGLDSPHP